MVTQALPSPELQAADLFKQLDVLYPQLPEPHRGATSYAIMVAHDPSIDEKFCEQAGKVVHVKCQLKDKADHPVTIRGQLGKLVDGGPLSWTQDRVADSQATPDFFHRTYTFHIPTDHMKEVLSFKLFNQGKWQSGGNCNIDLSTHGHIVNVQVTGIAFA